MGEGANRKCFAHAEAREDRLGVQYQVHGMYTSGVNSTVVSRRERRGYRRVAEREG